MAKTIELLHDLFGKLNSPHGQEWLQGLERFLRGEDVWGDGYAPPNALLLRPIEDLELPVRAYNGLKQIGVKTIGELIECSEGELFKLRNFGEKSLMEVEAKLESLGLSLCPR